MRHYNNIIDLKDLSLDGHKGFGKPGFDPDKISRCKHT
jgi:hypothetical protein